MTRSLAKRKLGLTTIAFFLTIGCESGPGSDSWGIALTSSLPWPHPGPMVVFDPLRQPDPEIPFPNDFACAFDDSSPTHCRVNVSTEATTNVERRLKERLDRLTGFSTFGPISVSFDGPLDLTTVRDDTVLLLRVPDEKVRVQDVQPVPLDLGRGSFPVNMGALSLFPGDPGGGLGSLVFPRDNLWDVDGDGVPEPVYHYEVATNTLLIRPMLPLAQNARYAVVLTRGLMGYSKKGTYGPVMSPFDYVNHPSQTRALRKVLPALQRLGVGPQDIAFAWTFPTQDITSVVSAIRDGMYGRGKLARLDKDVDRKFAAIDDTGISFDGDGSRPDLPFDPWDNIAILQAEYMDHVISFVGSLFSENPKFSFKHVDYFVFGWIRSPNFLQGPDRVFDVDLRTGRASYQVVEIPFMASIPKESDTHHPPFPVVLYAHGNGTSRLEGMLFAEAAARQGLAIVALDNVGYGPLAPGVDALMEELGLDEETGRLLLLFVADLVLPGGQQEVADLSYTELVDRLRQVGLLKEFIEYGRAIDLDGDGSIHNGEGFFLPQPFSQRDVFRQMQVDYMAMVRVLRNLDQQDVPPPVNDPGQKRIDELLPNLLAGDFNCDGRLDLGGPDTSITMAGTSLGGTLTVLVGGVEPEIEALAPLVPGGGLVDVFTRSHLRGFFDASFYFVVGPILWGCEAGGKVYVTFNALPTGGEAKNKSQWNCDPDKVAPVAIRVLDARPFRVQVANLNTLETAAAESDEHGNFHVALASDKGDVWRVTVLGQDGGVLDEFLAVVPEDGLGIARNTPRFRRNLSVVQAIMDPGDPVNFARFVAREPLHGRPKGYLQSSVIADWTVPFSTQVALARAVGALGLDQKTWLLNNQLFVEQGLMRGEDFDVDDLDRNNGGFGPLPVVAAGESKVLAVRFANVHGFHEYMATPGQAQGFDFAQYTHDMIALFLASAGTRVEDSLCIEDAECPCLDDPALPCRF